MEPQKVELYLRFRNELDIPVKFVGLGEKMDDLQVFDAEKYVYGLFADLVDTDMSKDIFLTSYKHML